MEERIGTAAGTIWRVLAEHGPITLTQLKRATKLTDSVFHMGLGWLAREGKLAFEETQRGVRVALRERRP